MEFRSQASYLCLVLLTLPAVGQTSEYPARHDHWRGGCAGFVRVTPAGISFEQISHKKTRHHFAWKWDDIQQLEITDDRFIRILSYKDRVQLAGSDQPYDFTLDGTPDLKPLARQLRGSLDQRLVSRLADTEGDPLWTVPVKRLGAIEGTQGELKVFANKLVYQTAAPRQSRTWRDIDLQTVASANPFELTLTSFERNGVFHFQLKETLDASRYQELWLRLNKPKGLSLLQP